jgi:hypothetical protein
MKPIIEGQKIQFTPRPPLTPQAISEYPTAPEQIWMSLAPAQQQEVIQVLIRVCQQLVRNNYTGVRHECD